MHDTRKDVERIHEQSWVGSSGTGKVEKIEELKKILMKNTRKPEVFLAKHSTCSVDLGFACNNERMYQVS